MSLLDGENLPDMPINEEDQNHLRIDSIKTLDCLWIVSSFVLLFFVAVFLMPNLSMESVEYINQIDLNNNKGFKDFSFKFGEFPSLNEYNFEVSMVLIGEFNSKKDNLMDFGYSIEGMTYGKDNTKLLKKDIKNFKVSLKNEKETERIYLYENENNFKKYLLELSFGNVNFKKEKVKSIIIYNKEIKSGFVKYKRYIRFAFSMIQLYCLIKTAMSLKFDEKYKVELISMILLVLSIITNCYFLFSNSVISFFEVILRVAVCSSFYFVITTNQWSTIILIIIYLSIHLYSFISSVLKSESLHKKEALDHVNIISGLILVSCFLISFPKLVKMFLNDRKIPSILYTLIGCLFSIAVVATDVINNIKGIFKDENTIWAIRFCLYDLLTILFNYLHFPSSDEIQNNYKRI